GGIQRLKSFKSIKITGKIATQGVEISIVVQKKRPNSFRADASFQGKSIVQAYDGETGWEINPFAGSSEPENVAGEELKGSQEQADFDGSLIDYKEKGNTVELLGKEDLEGSPAYKLKVALKNGDVVYVYLDGENYLEIKSVSKRKTPGGEIE